MTTPNARRTTSTPSATNPDYLTVLYTQPGHFASKTISCKADGSIEIQDFNAGLYFGVLDLPSIGDIYTLSNYLSQLESIPNALAIRGQPLPHLAHGTAVYRRKVNFQSPERGHHWVMIDVDKYPLPRRLLSKRLSHAVVEYLITKLPTEFHDVTYHWAFSSSAGVKNHETVSAHIWFWLTQAVSDEELTRWGYFVNEGAGHKLIDTALFRAVQPHYTAAPQFVGMNDPLPIRSGLCRKKHDAVALQLPLPKTPLKRGTNPTSAANQIDHLPANPDDVGFENRLARIGDHPGGQGFYVPLLNAAASYVATYGEQGTDVEVLFAILHDAAMAADRSHHTLEYVEHRASREQIMPMIESAIPKFGQDDRPRTKPRLIKGIGPYYKANPITSEEASRQIAAMIKGALS
jgi:hypothetical protein